MSLRLAVESCLVSGLGDATTRTAAPRLGRPCWKWWLMYAYKSWLISLRTFLQHDLLHCCILPSDCCQQVIIIFCLLHTKKFKFFWLAKLNFTLCNDNNNNYLQKRKHRPYKTLTLFLFFLGLTNVTPRTPVALYKTQLDYYPRMCTGNLINYNKY